MSIGAAAAAPAAACVHCVGVQSAGVLVAARFYLYQPEDMLLCLPQYLGTGEAFWLTLQNRYDLESGMIRLSSRAGSATVGQLTTPLAS